MHESKLLKYLRYYENKSKKLFALSITKSALSTLILIIPLLYELYKDIPIKYKLSFIILVAIINIYLVRNEIRKPNIKIEELLEMLIKTISKGDRRAIGEYRANIMLYNHKSNILEMKYHYNMMGSIDRDLIIDSNSGCCGIAFKENKPIWVDLEENPEAGYISDRKRTWGDMKSIISVPISTNNGREIVGILNVDTKNKVDDISQENVYETINMYSYIISKIL
ncbi:MAG: GAF domain-containing protein [Candidatus Methanofastidiosa archaeon]|nr:GAF domain-containing protein [Candidatus Methanofastidiosa archaeon]